MNPVVSVGIICNCLFIGPLEQLMVSASGQSHHQSGFSVCFLQVRTYGFEHTGIVSDRKILDHRCDLDQECSVFLIDRELSLIPCILFYGMEGYHRRLSDPCPHGFRFSENLHPFHRNRENVPFTDRDRARCCSRLLCRSDICFVEGFASHRQQQVCGIVVGIRSAHGVQRCRVHLEHGHVVRNNKILRELIIAGHQRLRILVQFELARIEGSGQRVLTTQVFLVIAVGDRYAGYIGLTSSDRYTEFPFAVCILVSMDPVVGDGSICNCLFIGPLKQLMISVSGKGHHQSGVSVRFLQVRRYGFEHIGGVGDRQFLDLGLLDRDGIMILNPVRFCHSSSTSSNRRFRIQHDRKRYLLITDRINIFTAGICNRIIKRRVFSIVRHFAKIHMCHVLAAGCKITSRFSVFHNELDDVQFCFSAGKCILKHFRSIFSVRKCCGVIDLCICLERQFCGFLIKIFFKDKVFLKSLCAFFRNINIGLIVFDFRESFHVLLKIFFCIDIDAEIVLFFRNIKTVIFFICGISKAIFNIILRIKQILCKEFCIFFGKIRIFFK